jgi:4-amino-4-deoxy-L-arabinose transferase-like glycosyltransferase
VSLFGRIVAAFALVVTGSRARRIPLALALVCAAGAALRFATLDVQSLWYDEAVTARLLRLDLSGLLHAIPDSESSPPLYYALAWLWTRAFGTGEVGVRSLSALVGTATIPVVWALAKRIGGDRAALFAATLVAVNPMLVWFSQEARAYALLVLLAALSALLWLRALEQPRAGRAAAWGVVAALALATHYYAIFVVAPQGLWLALRLPGARIRAAALAPVAVALAALAPLALAQRANDSAAFIRDSALGTRIVQVPKQLLVGYDSPAETLLAVLSGVVLVVALAGLWARIARGPRGGRYDDDLRLAALLAAALVLPALAALAGEDHLITRNLLAAAPLGAALAAAGLVQAEQLWPALRPAAIAGACALGLAAVIGVALDPRSQRDDWRGAVRALGTTPGQRIIVASPASALAPLRYYLPGIRPLTEAAIATAEIDYVALSERSPGERPKPPRPRAAPTPVPGFPLIARREADTFTVLRLRAATTLPIPRTAVLVGLDGRADAVLVGTR